ncbi:NAD-dependent epimerase/dehydratase family protein [Gammaproteobacteria bacterium]|nr:NAD-dependent epimerase/dehydratase family protein [Gammaproteobacteria bacterium]|tara:strand:+ start:8894 stop:9997 length:1104 start_codon:yes stop_codon:yes gene_type:complete
MKIIVTGANGFIGKNLCVNLKEQKQYDVLEVNRETSEKVLLSYLSEADFVFHLAGVNRPEDISEFEKGNIDLTNFIVKALEKFGRKVPIVLSSSSQIDQDTPYGKSKLAAEKVVESYSDITGSMYYIFRFPNVFGKWCKPNYNSFVATFCNNILNGLEISIHDPGAKVRLVYIDDVCESLLELLDGGSEAGLIKVPTEFKTTVGEVAKIISSFKSSRGTLVSERVGEGLVRALYSTYLSYVPSSDFSYSIPSYIDKRGVFCEMLKTKDSGQFSYFTAHPGITRGGHYHHTKTEKFLVIKGMARFCFRNILTNEKHSKHTAGGLPEIVETVPGWSHDITNIGSDELIVMLWANEIFDPEHPDTMEATV